MFKGNISEINKIKTNMQYKELIELKIGPLRKLAKQTIFWWEWQHKEGRNTPYETEGSYDFD